MRRSRLNPKNGEKRQRNGDIKLEETDTSTHQEHSAAGRYN